jgi:dTDP-4-dehydrorhamnose reductase
LGYSESSSPAPLNVYALTKLLGEPPILNAGGLAVRTNIYGFNRHRPGNSIFEWAMSSLRYNKPMIGYQDVIFNPVSVWQLSRSLDLCLRLDLRGLINIAGDMPISKADFLAATIRLNRPDFTLIEVQDAPLSPIVRPKQTTLDITRSSELGLPTLNLHEGISEVSEFYKRDFGF